MKRSGLYRYLYTALVLGVTFVSAYVPTIYSALDPKGDESVQDAKGSEPAQAPKGGKKVNIWRDPNVLGGLMGFLFSVLFTIGESHYRKVDESIDQLNRKIDAQNRGSRLQEAFLKAKEGPYSPLFGKLAERRLERIQSDLEDMMRDLPFYEVRQSDPVKEYVDIFVKLMLDIIHPGSEFRVVTTEVIWSPNGFGGPDRRYLLANYIAAKERKVKLKRVFMVDQRENVRDKPERAQKFLDMLRDHERTFEEQDLEVDLAVYEVESDADYNSFFRNPSNNFAIWNVSANDSICTVVEYEYTPNGYQISGFRFASDPMLIKEKSAVFGNLRARATDLHDYIRFLESLVKEHQVQEAPVV